MSGTAVLLISRPAELIGIGLFYEQLVILLGCVQTEEYIRLIVIYL
jgi:hypothetical protein